MDIKLGGLRTQQGIAHLASCRTLSLLTAAFGWKSCWIFERRQRNSQTRDLAGVRSARACCEGTLVANVILTGSEVSSCTPTQSKSVPLAVISWYTCQNMPESSAQRTPYHSS